VTTFFDVLPSQSPFEADLFLYLPKSTDCDARCVSSSSLLWLCLEYPDILLSNNWYKGIAVGSCKAKDSELGEGII
jgi:hypothetical protein